MSSETYKLAIYNQCAGPNAGRKVPCDRFGDEPEDLDDYLIIEGDATELIACYRNYSDIAKHAGAGNDAYYMRCARTIKEYLKQHVLEEFRFTLPTSIIASKLEPAFVSCCVDLKREGSILEGWTIRENAEEVLDEVSKES